MLSELEQKLYSHLSEVTSLFQSHIDFISYKKKGKEFILTIYVERDDYSPLTLDDICLISEALSNKLDEIDLIKDNYSLDVSTSGAEKEIKDFSKFPSLIGKYFEIRLINPIDGENIYLGTLESVEEGIINLSFKIKTRTKIVRIEIDNIAKAMLTVKI